MYIVFRWFKSSDDSLAEVVGAFPDESSAEQYCVFYATLHMISVDDLDVCSVDASLEKIVDEVFLK